MKHMLQHLKTFSLAAAMTVATSGALSAQSLKIPTASPLQTVKQSFALSEISLEYSRPSAKGRVIFGEVVPFGKVWRTGANASTKITFGEEVKVEGNTIPAGTYALYTIPNKDSWEIIIYKDLTLGGNVANYKKENDVAHFTVKPKALNEQVESFTINFSSLENNSLNVELSWEKTRVSFRVEADIDAKIMKDIENSIVKDNRPYFQAANYYYETGKDLNKANEWVDKAIEANPKAFWIVMLKAKIQTKQKDSKGAIATAEKVITLATEAKNDDYVAMAKKVIAENKK
jgi:hypothetical protein